MFDAHTDMFIHVVAAGYASSVQRQRIFDEFVAQATSVKVFCDNALVQGHMITQTLCDVFKQDDQINYNSVNFVVDNTLSRISATFVESTFSAYFRENSARWRKFVETSVSSNIL